MRVLIQRVKEASVTVDGKVISLIDNGLLLFVGITDDDTRDDILWLTKKIANIRLFDDENGVMNHSVIDVDGEVLAVSQFTLMASTKKGNRPSFTEAMYFEKANDMFNIFVEELRQYDILYPLNWNTMFQILKGENFPCAMLLF